MNQRSCLKRSRHHLKGLVETVVADMNVPARGLAFIVDELEAFGSPPERLKVWATLHFLRLGSPFCCCEPFCHLPLFGERLDRVNDALRRQMGLRQKVAVEFVAINGVVSCAGVEFDSLSGYTPMASRGESDFRDGLGRTALMRAAIRGYDRQVEELLALGADPTVVDNRGRGIMELMSRRSGWFASMVEEALARAGNVRG